MCTRASCPRIYFEGVTLAGGIAVLLPPQPVDAEIAARVLDGLDGLIITGGKDVDPATLRPRAAPDHRRARAATATRGSSRCCAARCARRMPVLGICRGAQVLNVALGGTLHQHLPDVLGHTRHQQGNAVFTTSTVRTVAGHPARRADRRRPPTRSATTTRPSTGSATGWSSAPATPTAVIEAVEMPGDDFVLAVQWHPEETLDDLRLFAGLVRGRRGCTRPKG